MSIYRIADSDNPLETTQNSTISPNRYIAENAFLRETLPTSLQYCSLAKPAVLNFGSGYSLNATIVFPEPSFEGGILAAAEPIFGLSNLSISLQDNGSGHLVGDLYYVTSENSSYATILVTQTDNNGSITGYKISDPGFNFDNTNVSFVFSPVIKTSLFSRTIVEATFSFIPDKFSIVDINMTNYGSGYQTLYSDFKTTVIHTVTVSDAGGSGFYAITSARPSSQVIANENTGEFSVFRPQITIDKDTDTPSTLAYSYSFNKHNNEWVATVSNGTSSSSTEQTCEDPNLPASGYDIAHISFAAAIPASFVSDWDDLDPEKTVILSNTEATIDKIKADDLAKVTNQLEDLMVDSYQKLDAFELETIKAVNGARSGSFNIIDSLDPTWRGPLSTPETLERDLAQFMARRTSQLNSQFQQEIIERIKDGRLSHLAYSINLRGPGGDVLLVRVLKRLDSFFQNVDIEDLIKIKDMLDEKILKELIDLQKRLERIIRSKSTYEEINRIIILVKNSKKYNFTATKKVCAEAYDNFLESLKSAKGKKALIGGAIAAAIGSSTAAFADDEYIETITEVAGTAIEFIPPDPIEIALGTIAGEELGDSEIDFSYDRLSEMFDQIFNSWLNDEISDEDLIAIFNNTTIIQDNLSHWTPDGKTFPFGHLPNFHRDYTDIETYLTLEDFLEMITEFKDGYGGAIIRSKKIILETYRYNLNQIQGSLDIEIEDCEPYCDTQDNSKPATLSVPVKTSINLDPIILHYGSDGIIKNNRANLLTD